MQSVLVKSHTVGFSWTMTCGRKSDLLTVFLKCSTVADHKLLLDIQSSWRGKAGMHCNSVSGMRLEMSSKKVSQMSLTSIRKLMVNEIGSRALLLAGGQLADVIVTQGRKSSHVL